MIRRRLEPKRGHALFFPETSEIVVGGHKLLWWWASCDFHHIELGHFPVYVEFGLGKQLEVARSAEGLLFKVKAVFRVETKQDADALRKATRLFPPVRDLNKTIGLREFEARLQGCLQIVVIQALAKREYLSSDAAQFRQLLLTDIDTKARELLAKDEGFSLLACTISELTPELPNEHTLAQDSKLRERWMAYSGTLEEIHNEGTQIEQDREVREKQRKRVLQEAEESQNSESEVKRKQIIKERDEKLNAIADAVEQDQEKRTKERAERQQKNREAEEEIKQKRIKAENATDLIAAQEKAKVKTEQDKAKLDQISFERRCLEEELGLQQLREQAAKAQAVLAEAEAKRFRAIGEAEASVTREKALAANAQVLQTHRELLDALPKILEKITTTTPKAGEMKIMYFGNSTSQAVGGVGDTNLSGLISGVSSLSVLRELLQFIGEWNATGQRSETIGAKTSLSDPSQSA